VTAALAGTASAGTAGIASPDPCAVSQGALNAALSASAGTAQYGTPGTKAVHGVQVATCTWTYGNKEVVTSVAPKSLSRRPSANPAGTVSRPVAGFGPGARLLTNNRAGYVFIAVTFAKGTHWGEAWGSAGVTKTQILRVGRSLYAKL
jgi:hypothetical protein